jgi:hypothetical protein
MTTPSDPRDQLWDVAFESWYDVSYQECLSEALITRWLRLDQSSKILVALTSSGSALAGLVLWKDPSFAWLWPTLTAISASLALIVQQLAVTHKLKVHTDTMQTFTSLKIDIDTLRNRMRIDPMFDIKAFEKDYLALRKRYSEAQKSVASDIWDTHSLRQKVQDILNKRLDQ